MSVTLYKATGSGAYAGTNYYFSTTTSGSKAIGYGVWAFLNKRVISNAGPSFYVGVLFADTSTSITPPSTYSASQVVATTTYGSSLTSLTSITDGGVLYKNDYTSTQYFTAPTATTVHTRAFAAAHGGTVSTTGYGYEFIGTNTATPTASANHVFVEWRNVSDDSAVVPTTGLTIDATTKKITVAASYAQDVNVYAFFRSTVVEINGSVSGDGTLSIRVDGVVQSAITGLVFDRDDVHTVRLTNTPAYGKKFYRYGITPAEDGVSGSVSYPPTEDHTFYTETDGPDLYTIVAYFITRPTAALSVSKVNPSYGTISLTLSNSSVINETAGVINTSVFEGYTHTLTATVTNPSTNYFVGWFSDSGATTLVSSSASYAFTPDGDDVTSGITLYAVFREKADIAVTTEIQLDGVPEASDFDGNVFSTYTSAPLKAGDIQFTLSYNTGHYWGKPSITVTELTIGGSSAYNSLTYAADDYEIDVNGRVTLPLSPLQAWAASDDPINFTVSADFPAEQVGPTVIEGANAGTYAWMYAVTFTDWDGRGYTTPEAEPDRPMNPLYGDTGTVTIVPIDDTKIKIGRVTVKYGDVTVIDEATTVSNEDSFAFTANVTGPMTITVQMKATVTVSGGSGTLPAELDFTINGTVEEDLTATVVVGAVCNVDFVGTPTATVFDGWTAAGYATYTAGEPPAMVATVALSDVRPYAFTPNGNTTIVPSFVTADTDPYVVVQFFNASTNAVFTPGGSNPTVSQSGGDTSTRDLMRAQVGGLAAGNFDTAFAASGSTLFLSFSELETLTLTASGTETLPFLRFEKAAITKGDGLTEDCVIGEWSAITPVTNPAAFTVVVSCAYRAVFGAYQPQKNTAAYRTSAMRSMGAITVTGYNTATAADGSVSAYTGYGDSVTWAASPNIGYVFSGWYSLSGETYTLVSSLAEYTIEQDSVARTLYASFTQDTTRLYLMEGGTARKTAQWKSKRYEMARPVAFSAARCDADEYNVRVQAHAFSSPNTEDQTDLGILDIEDQDARRLPSMRKERFFEFSVETVHPVTGVSFSTTMQGLS